jgi:serralysin
MPDVPGSALTNVSIGVGGSLTNTLEIVGDHDWFAITLSAGQSITVVMEGFGITPLEDPYLRLRDSHGNEIAFNDDGAGDRNARLNFTATTSGTYYIDASSWSDAAAGYPGYTGAYQLSVMPYTPPPVFDYDQIADQLVNGYWESVGGTTRHFNVTEGGTITVNLTGLTSAGQYLARHALELWTDSLGIHFQEIAGSAQITFDDDDGDASEIAAFSTSVTSGNTIISSDVNIDTGWISQYGTSLNSYSFQTYLHEIGHALGLGHAGNYNGSADYMQDALYQNDAWSTTVMSYFSQEQNSYFSNRGFTYDYVVTPMVGDLVAMSILYGTPTTTRTGDTIYGFHSNAGREVYDATELPGVGYTVIDSGGIDTLDYSGFSFSQRIDLNQEAFSNVGGATGNVSIARGTVIENAIGGNGADVLIGNSADNILTGNGGNDKLDGNSGRDTASYAGASSGVTVNLGISGAQNTGGAGSDTLTSIENLIGSAYNDTLTGNSSANQFIGGAGNDMLNGAGGVDLVDYSSAGSAVAIDLGASGAQNTRGAGLDTLISIEQVIGSDFADRLTGNGADNLITGGNGNDTIIAGGGNDILEGGAGTDSMDGGAGNDRIYGGAGSDYVTYATARSGVVVNLSLTTVQNTGGGGSDQLFDIERMYGSNYDDTLTGSSADNLITGRYGDDHIVGGSGYDRLQGDAGNDVIDAGIGNDVVIGGVGDDILNGGDGNDRLYGQAGNDVISGGAGIDVVYYADAAAGVTVSLATTAAQNTGGAGIDTLSGIERMVGSKYADDITGASGAERLIGGVGNDVMRGGGGNDIVQGDAGNDVVSGGGGNDSLYGGAGQDTFRFDAALNGSTNVDTLREFSSVDDTFQLDQAVFSAISAGTLDASAFRIGASAADASDRIIYNQADGRIYYDADGSGSGAQVLFARVHAGVTITSADFAVDGSSQAILGGATVQTAVFDSPKGAPVSAAAAAVEDPHFAGIGETSLFAMNHSNLDYVHTYWVDHFLI